MSNWVVLHKAFSTPSRELIAINLDAVVSMQAMCSTPEKGDPVHWTQVRMSPYWYNHPTLYEGVEESIGEILKIGRGHTLPHRRK